MSERFCVNKHCSWDGSSHNTAGWPPTNAERACGRADALWRIAVCLACPHGLPLYVLQSEIRVPGGEKLQILLLLNLKKTTQTITNSKQLHTGRVSTLLKCQERSSSSKFRKQEVKQQLSTAHYQDVSGHRHDSGYLRLDLQKCKNAQTGKKPTQLVASRD